MESKTPHTQFAVTSLSKAINPQIQISISCFFLFIYFHKTLPGGKEVSPFTGYFCMCGEVN